MLLVTKERITQEAVSIVAVSAQHWITFEMFRELLFVPTAFVTLGPEARSEVKYALPLLSIEKRLWGAVQLSVKESLEC